MLMQNSGVTNKEHYGMLWYFQSSQFQFAKGDLDGELLWWIMIVINLHVLYEFDCVK